MSPRSTARILTALLARRCSTSRGARATKMHGFFVPLSSRFLARLFDHAPGGEDQGAAEVGVGAFEVGHGVFFLVVGKRDG